MKVNHSKKKKIKVNHSKKKIMSKRKKGLYLT